MEADRQMPRRKIAFPLPDVPKIWLNDNSTVPTFDEKTDGEATNKSRRCAKKQRFLNQALKLFWSTLQQKKN